MQGAWAQSLGWEILHAYAVAVKKKKKSKQTNKITEQKQTKNTSRHCALTAVPGSEREDGAQRLYY